MKKEELESNPVKKGNERRMRKKRRSMKVIKGNERRMRRKRRWTKQQPEEELK